MVILDWGPEIGMAKFLTHVHSDGDNKPDTILVNGLGRFKAFVGNDNQTIYNPTARFVVERVIINYSQKSSVWNFLFLQGYRYRFRVINAEFLNCPIELSVDNHTITIISSDGNDFHPITGTSN